jgi:hypothetical protein
MGVNLPVMFVKMCQGDDWKCLAMNIHGSATYVNERMLFDDWKSGFISFTKFRNMRNEADICFITDADDFQPEKEFRSEIRKQRIVNLIKKLIKRR